MFGDDAVIQRRQTVRVAGSVGASEALTFELGDVSRAVDTDRSGWWAATFPAPASTTGTSIEVRGTTG